MRIKLTEALRAYSDRTGLKLTQKEIAEAVYPNSSPESRAINLSRIATGTATTINTDTVIIICKMTGVDANFLFGINN